MYKISFIVPVYNVEKYIERCIESIVNQTVDSMEVICIDDCSTDGSLEVLNKFVKKYPVIKILRNEKNCGLGYTRNRGLEIASGKYVWFVDSDDWISDTDAACKVIDIADNDDLDMLIFGLIQEFENEELKTAYENYGSKIETYGERIILGEDLFGIQIKDNSFIAPVCFKLFKRDYLSAIGLKMPEVIHEDIMFSALAMLYAERVKIISDKLYCYYRHQNSITTNNYNIGKKVAAYVYIVAELFDNLNKKDFKGTTKDALVIYIKELKGIIADGFMECLRHNRSIEFKCQSNEILFRMIIEEYYPYISHKLDHALYMRINEATGIIVYGAGNVSMSVQKFLNAMGLNDYYVAISNSNTQGLYTLKELYEDNKDALILVSATSEKQKEMVEYALGLGYKDYYLMS